MDGKKKHAVITILFVAVVLMVGLSAFFEAPREVFERYLSGNPLAVGAVYTGLIIIATVVAPFSALPLAPVTALALGPFLTAILSIIGWTVGAVIAFLIARHVGRPLLARFVDVRRVEKYEAYVPHEHAFWWLVFLRALLPVDVLSYAVGIASTIPLSLYTLATLIGVTPFSFVWVYGGNALLERNYQDLIVFIGAGLLFFAAAVYVYLRWRNRDR